jgi:hypothetical protein
MMEVKAMTTTQKDQANDSNQTLAERATSLFQGGIDAVRNNPGTAAAVLGSVAAAAAAYVGRDKIAETAGNLKERVSSSNKQNENA